MNPTEENLTLPCIIQTVTPQRIDNFHIITHKSRSIKISYNKGKYSPWLKNILNRYSVPKYKIINECAGPSLPIFTCDQGKLSRKLTLKMQEVQNGFFLTEGVQKSIQKKNMQRFFTGRSN